MKITIIGAGKVGSDIANYLVFQDNISELLIINRNMQKAEAEALDLRQAREYMPTNNSSIMAGTYRDMKGSAVVIISAGVPLSDKIKDKEALGKANAPIIKYFIKKIEKYAPEALVIIASNPVDSLAYYAIENTIISPKKIISSGTINDTARLKNILKTICRISSENINCMVLGEHSAANFIPWSLVKIAGVDIDLFCLNNDISLPDKGKILNEINKQGFKILNGKKYTDHGIAAGVCRIVRAIIRDENAILPVGVFLYGTYDVRDTVMSMPAIINRNGFAKLAICDFNDEEMKQIKKSAQSIRKTINIINSTNGGI